MRSIWRSLDPVLARDIALVLIADTLVAVSFGAITVGAGLPLWLPMVLSVVVFAGAAQFIFVGLIASGGNPLAAVLAGLLVNARHLPFGFAVADLLGSGWRRLVGAHLMIDESVAFALAQPNKDQRKRAFWVTSVSLFVCWNLGVVGGAIAGTAITDTSALGLDAAFPAVLLALLVPSLRDSRSRYAALAGAVIALATTPFLPAGLPVLLALAGVAVAEVGREPAQERS